MKTEVIFEYCEEAHKWEVYIKGVKDEVEAMQALNVVLMSSRLALITTEHKATLEGDRYKMQIAC